MNGKKKEREIVLTFETLYLFDSNTESSLRKTTNKDTNEDNGSKK